MFGYLACTTDSHEVAEFVDSCSETDATITGKRHKKLDRHSSKPSDGRSEKAVLQVACLSCVIRCCLRILVTHCKENTPET